MEKARIRAAGRVNERKKSKGSKANCRMNGEQAVRICRKSPTVAGKRKVLHGVHSKRAADSVNIINSSKGIRTVENKTRKHSKNASNRNRKRSDVLKTKQRKIKIPHEQHFYEKYVKRPQDFCLSLGAIVVLSPVMAVTAVLVRTKLGTPVLFCQERPGKDGKVFKMYKFRTMTDAKDKDGKLLPDEVRLTEFGKKLRATSLDELPELFNILKGDMAIVGPRPLLVQYLPLYNDHQKRRHEVRPGFTGLAQVNGRNAISWEKKFDYDVEYVDSVSFKKDWEIIFKTIKTVLTHEGISSGTSATMEAFTGTVQ